MDWLNISLSILAIAVSIFAIIQSSLIANRSNNIALLSQRIEFYNKITNIIEVYSILPVFKDMLKAKNANLVFGQQAKMPNPITSMILGHLASQEKEQNIMFGIQRIDRDINYLEINKYLFKKDIINSISNIENELQKLKEELRECLKTQSDNNIQDLLIKLKSLLKDFDKGTKQLIVKTISKKK